jgi:hypothetical protein
MGEIVGSGNPGESPLRSNARNSPRLLIGSLVSGNSRVRVGLSRGIGCKHCPESPGKAGTSVRFVTIPDDSEAGTMNSAVALASRS